MSKKIFLAFAVFCVISLTGCYDNDEIDTLATVMAVGIEDSQNSDTKLYTFAVSSSLDKESSGDSSSLICYTEEQKSLRDAVDAVDRKISKRLSFSHLSAILFSKKTAKRGMYGDVSFFEKDYKVRPQMMIALTDISPGKYLEGLKPELESNPEKYFQSVFQRSKTYVSSMRLSDFTNAYHTGQTALAPVISGKIGTETITEEDAFIISSALISGGKFVLEITDNPFVGLFFSDKKVSFDGKTLRSAKAPSVKVCLSGKNARIDVSLYVQTDDKKIAKKVQNEAQVFLKSCANKALDIINVSKTGAKNFLFLDKYNEVNWQEVLKNAYFNVNVEVVEEVEM